MCVRACLRERERERKTLVRQTENVRKRKRKRREEKKRERRKEEKRKRERDNTDFRVLNHKKTLRRAKKIAPCHDDNNKHHCNRSK